jgi:hypothetical protein
VDFSGGLTAMPDGNNGERSDTKRPGQNKSLGRKGTKRRREKLKGEGTPPDEVSSLVAQQGESKDPNEKLSKPKKASKPLTKWWFWDPDPIVRLTGWIASFTFVLMAVGLLQAWAYIQRERAVVNVTRMNLSTGDFVPDQEFRFEVSFRNSGGVAARPISAFIGTRTVNPPGPEHYLIGKTNLPNFIIPAGQEIRQYYSLPKKKDGQTVKLTSKDIESLKKGNPRFFVFGQTRYLDSFSFLTFWPLTTTFCYEYVPSVDPKGDNFIFCRSEL